MKRLSAVSLAAFALIACGPPSPAEVAAKMGNDVEDLVKGGITTARYTNSMQVRDDLFATSSASDSSRYWIPETSSTDQTFADWRTLSTRVFREENVIERPAGAVIFAVKGVDMCTPLRGAGTASTQCIQDVERAQLAIRASGGVDLTFLVGPNRYAPLTFRIRSKQSLALEVDLAQAVLASDYMNATFGENRGAPIFSGSSGKVELKLERHAEADYSLRFSILNDLVVRVTDSGGIARAFTSKATQPLASLRVDGTARRVTSELNVGQTEYQGLWSDFNNYGSLRTPMAASLSGLTWSAVLQDGQEPRVMKFGLGPNQSTVSFGGQKVFAIDLNEKLGRRAEVEWTKSAAGAPLLKVKPGLNAQLFFRLRPVQEAGGTVDAEHLDATYTYGLLEDGGQVPALEILKNNGFGWYGGVRLVSGKLTLSSSDASAPSRTFSAGTCLVSFSGPRTSSMLDLFSAAPCP